jgi:uncharacterized protein with GYD domain
MGIVAGGPRDTYFSLWTLTDKGIADADALNTTIETASAMIRSIKGAECHFYVAVGGRYDYIGVATGVDDRTIVAIQRAIEAFGTLRADFIKTIELSLKDFDYYLTKVGGFRALKAP